MRIKKQYYRDRKAYLFRLYCGDCGNEMKEETKKDNKYLYKCDKCNSQYEIDIKYPYWKYCKIKK